MKALTLILPLVYVLLASCASYTELSYKDFERDLGNDHQLTISTYPAGFPTETSHTPYVSSSMKSADKVYFQVHVGDVPATPSPNPNKVTIHSFQYIIANRSWNTLIKGYKWWVIFPNTHYTW